MTAVAARPTSGRWGFGHVPALDGLRGAAVAAVLVYHLGHLEGGYLGVDLFFVLSGFLITSLLLAEHEGRGGVGLADFWARRARRLLPALLLLLVGVAAYAQWIARPVDLASIRADGLATLLYVANWHAIVDGGSYWDISLAPSPLQHAWSLAIEEQFYVVWPLVVVWVAKRAKAGADRAVLAVAGWGALASAAWLVALYAMGASDTRVYQGTDTRAAALLGGAALAAWHRLHPVDDGELGASAAARTRSVGLAAAVALGACWIWLPGTSPWLYRGGLALASALAVVVVGAVVRGGASPLGRALSVAPLRGLGAISYGLYLWHWPVYQGIDARNGRLPLLGDTVVDGAALVALKLAVSLALALASYRLVEQPIRHSDWRGRPLLVGSAAAMAVVALLLVAATAGGVTVRGQEEPIGDPTEVLAAAPDVLYVGDSVAQSIVAPVVDDPSAFGINPINRTYPGCQPIAQGRPARSFAGGEISPEPCFRALDEELPGLAPDAIVLLVGSRPNDHVQIDGEWVGACDPAWNVAYEDAMADLAERLRTSGAPVAIGTITRTSANAVVQVERSDEKIGCANDALARVVERVPGTTLVDVNELVCPEPGACLEQLEGDDVRPDGLHFGDGPAGQEVARWVLERALAFADVTAAPTD